MKWVKISEGKPGFNQPVFVKMKWLSGKEIGAYLKRVNDDDCEWRTVDDNSEIDYSIEVVEYLDETTCGDGWVELKGVAGEMEDCNCWLYREDGQMFLSHKGEYVAIGEYSHYLPVVPPAPPSKY